MNNELIRQILDISPCIGSDDGFCRVHDQRVMDCNEYFDYHSKRIRELFVDSTLISFREHQRGYQEGWRDGRRHREDGPALVDGDCQEWYLNGQEMTEAQWREAVKKTESKKSKKSEK